MLVLKSSPKVRWLGGQMSGRRRAKPGGGGGSSRVPHTEAGFGGFARINQWHNLGGKLYVTDDFQYILPVDISILDV